MSIVIKGFDLPKSCSDCPLEIDGKCGGLAGEPLREGFRANIDRPLFCPLEKEVEYKPPIPLTTDEAFAVANHIDTTLFDSVRNDTEIDSMTWLRNIVHAYEKLCQYSGYTGLTENEGDES